MPGLALIHGELSWAGIREVLTLAEPKDGEVFVDMGSGLGKAVIAAALTCPAFKTCRGVEVVPGENCSPRHQTHFEPPFLELNDIL
jgi:hypothetical protein